MCKNNLKELQEIDKVLSGAHALFRSTKRQAEWALFAARYGVTRIKFPLFNKTRWFSRMQCITTLTLNLHVLILYLEEDGHDWPAAKEFLKKMKGMKIITTLFLLRDMVRSY